MWGLRCAGALALAVLVPGARATDCRMEAYKTEEGANLLEVHIGPLDVAAHAETATRGEISSIKLVGPPGCTGRFYCDEDCFSNTHFGGGFQVQPYSFTWTIQQDGSPILVTLKFPESNIPVLKLPDNTSALLQDPLGARIEVYLEDSEEPEPMPGPEGPSSPGLLQGGLPPQCGEVTISSQPNNLCQCETFGPQTLPFLDRSDLQYCGNHAGLLSEWAGAAHFTCPHCVDSGTVISVSCPNGWATCELLLNLYVCPGCSSGSEGAATTGLWPASLSEDGWTAAGRCTADFCSEGGRHPFVGFHKQISGGETLVLPETATAPTMYFSVLVKRGELCETLSATTTPTCEGSPFCSWTGAAEGGSCVSDWCPHQLGAVSGGPSNSCSASCAPGTGPEGGACPTPLSPPA